VRWEGGAGGKEKKKGGRGGGREGGREGRREGREGKGEGEGKRREGKGRKGNEGRIMEVLEKMVDDATANYEVISSTAGCSSQHPKRWRPTKLTKHACLFACVFTVNHSQPSVNHTVNQQSTKQSTTEPFEQELYGELIEGMVFMLLPAGPCFN